MAAEKSVKLADLGAEMFQMGLSFQSVLPCTPLRAYSDPWIPAARFICYGLSKSLDRENLTNENFQNLECLSLCGKMIIWSFITSLAWLFNIMSNSLTKSFFDILLLFKLKYTAVLLLSYLVNCE